MMFGSPESHRLNQQYGNVKFSTGAQTMFGTRGMNTPNTPNATNSSQPRVYPQGSVVVPQSKATGQRVAILIDVQDLYYGAKDLYNTKIAYNKFLDAIANGRQIVRSIAYVANRSGSNQSSFIGLLRGIGCDVKQKNAVEYDGYLKCNWGVEITIDAMMLAPKVDVIVIASGDGDFTHLLKTLKVNGIRTEVASFRQSASVALIDEADRFVDINRSMLIESDRAWARKTPRDADDQPQGEAMIGEDEADKENNVVKVDDEDTGEYEEPDYDEKENK